MRRLLVTWTLALGVVIPAAASAQSVSAPADAAVAPAGDQAKPASDQAKPASDPVAPGQEKPAPASPAAAPEASAAPTVETPHSLFDQTWHQFQFGGRATSIDGDPARFQRYQDVRDGVMFTDARYAAE